MRSFAFFGLGAGVVPLGLLILVVLIVIGGRNEPDPDHHRPRAVYYALVQLVTLFTVLFAAFGVTSSLLNLTTKDQPRSFTFQIGGRSTTLSRDQEFLRNMLDARRQQVVRRVDHDENNRDIANAARAAIIAVLAAGLYLFHERRRRRFDELTPGRRVRESYLYAVGFVSVLVAVGATAGALFSFLGVIAPGVFEASRRAVALRDGISVGLLAMGAAALFAIHLAEAEPSATAPPPPAPSAEPEPTPPTRPVAKKARAPRKKAV